MKILILVLSILLLLCGCSSEEGHESESLSFSGYETEMLDYKNAKSATFNTKSEAKEIKVGEQIGELKLEKLLSRTADDGFLNIRAEFSCDITVSGKVRYNKSVTYKNILQFYPPDGSLFPRVAGDNEPIKWVVIREDNSPLEQLGIEVSGSLERDITVRITGFYLNHTRHSTTNYITVEIVK